MPAVFLKRCSPNRSRNEENAGVLRGRLELIQRRPERAIGIFQGLLKRPEGAAHAALIAALFGIVEAHVQLKTPEIADDLIEEFIDRHPADPDLPLFFARLDELYRAEHKPSRNELEQWVRSPEQPRRTFARWYLARFEIRAGRRERARQLFTDVRHTGVKSPAIAPALMEFARFEVEDRHFDEAIAILDDARLLHPAPLCWPKSISFPRKRNIWRKDLTGRPRPLNKSGIPIRHGQRLRYLTRPPAGCNSVITSVFRLITTTLKDRAAMKNRAPICDWRKA